MAKDPKDNAERYGLSHDVAADMEADEGPALGDEGDIQHGENSTAYPRQAKHSGHGPKTRARVKAMINRHP